MKRKFLFMFLILMSCTQLPATPADIPDINTTLMPVPEDIPDVYPTPLPTPTLAVITKPINEEEMEEALSFFYEQKNNVALGEYEHFAEEVRYPITVMVDGTPKTYVYVAEFEADFERIFDKETIRRFISIDESELTFTPNGVKAADGIIWFDLICFDPDCEDADYLITEINN